MSSTLKVQMVIVAFLLGTLPAVAEEKQPQQPDFVAPIPSQILSAKSVFISNLGQDCVILTEDGLSGGVTRTYNQFYAAMKEWGRYQMVNSPADADLDFEIGFTCPPSLVEVLHGDSVGPAVDPQISVTILDVKTHVVLWGATEHLKKTSYGFLFTTSTFLPGGRKKAVKELEETYRAAMDRLVNDVKELGPKPAASTP